MKYLSEDKIMETDCSEISILQESLLSGINFLSEELENKIKRVEKLEKELSEICWRNENIQRYKNLDIISADANQIRCVLKSCWSRNIYDKDVSCAILFGVGKVIFELTFERESNTLALGTLHKPHPILVDARYVIEFDGTTLPLLKYYPNDSLKYLDALKLILGELVLRHRKLLDSAGRLGMLADLSNQILKHGYRNLTFEGAGFFVKMIDQNTYLLQLVFSHVQFEKIKISDFTLDVTAQHPAQTLKGVCIAHAMVITEEVKFARKHSFIKVEIDAHGFSEEIFSGIDPVNKRFFMALLSVLGRVCSNAEAQNDKLSDPLAAVYRSIARFAEGT